MKVDQIDQALQQKFSQGDTRIVFWHDTDGEFAETVRSRYGTDATGSETVLPGVTLLDLQTVGQFAVKLRLERDDTEGKYLVYSTGEKPEGEIDWLLDIRLYSQEFQADMTSLWWQELALAQLHLTTHLRARAKFLADAKRRSKLAELVTPQDDETSLDLKMMAVLSKTKITTLFEILQAVCGSFELETPCELLDTFEKMGLAETFWRLVQQSFGYEQESPTLAGLLRRLFLSELLQQAGGATLKAITHLQLPPHGTRNAVVLLTQWRDSSSRGPSYDAVAKALETEQNVAEVLRDVETEQLSNVFTFWTAERVMVAKLKSLVLEHEQTIASEKIAELAAKRKAGHWLSGPERQLPERQAVAQAYDAIVAAAELFELSQMEKSLYHLDGAAKIFEEYSRSLYRFDFLYRKFCEGSKLALGQGWDLLKGMAERIERLYDQAYLQPLARAWDRELDGGFLAQWRLPDVVSQQDFYAKVLKPHLDAEERKRAFVIISDAFRYEAAAQLQKTMSGKDGLVSELSPLLGVLPSFTKLGMASLLPRTSLAMDGADLLVDGRALNSVEARNEHLNRYQGMAVKADTVLQYTTEQVREATRDARVVYIYHNVIDSRGDNAATEEQTFEAVADCLRELESLVAVCVNKLNASRVWITADHGFLFQRQAPDQTDRSGITSKPPGTVLAKKRYLLGTDLGNSPDVHHGRVAVTSSAQGPMEFWVPRGTNRFHFSGGSRFIHGGAMPQEVVVPLLLIKQIRGKKAPSTKVEKVSVQVLGYNHRVTTPVHRFELIQTEPVSDRRKPITIRIAVYLDGKPVTSVETLTFDSASDAMEERKKSVRLELGNETFDKKNPYLLILREQGSDREVLSLPVVIDRSFDDDF